MIEFHVAKDVKLDCMELRRSSGVAIRLGQPFPAVPDELAKPMLVINGAFRYNAFKGSGKTSNPPGSQIAGR